MAKRMSKERERGMYQGYGRIATDDGLIKEDYTKHANVPDKVIFKDLDVRDFGQMRDYDDTMESIDRQTHHDRKKMLKNNPKSRY